MEAIVAATKASAQAIGRQNNLGTIEEEKIADLLIVNSNPLQNIKVLREKNSIEMIIKNGEIVVNRGIPVDGRN